jgi:DNA-binding transcriptional LysR family regulator
VNLEHLRLFRDLANLRSISRAARMNGVSQSAASQHVMEMERQFETPLVDRSTRPLTLTEAGRVYAEFCRDVTRLRHELEIGLEKVKGRVEGTVRVASIYSIRISEMSSLERSFAERFPDAELRVEYLRPEKVYKAVLDEQADLGLVSYPEPSKEIRTTPWRDERMVVAMSPRHPLADRGVLHPVDLDGADFIGFDDDLPISRDVARFLREAGVAVNRVMHFDNIQTMKEAVAMGTALSILPEPILQADVAEGRLRAVALEPGLSRPLGILQPRRRKPNRATQSFLGLLTESGARP